MLTACPWFWRFPYRSAPVPPRHPTPASIGALQRSRHERFFSLSERQTHSRNPCRSCRIGIGDAVLMVLGGDHRQRVGLVAVFLEIGLRDLARTPGKNTGGVAILRQIRRAAAGSCRSRGGVRVICSTPTTSTIFAAPAESPGCPDARRRTVAQAFSTRVAGLTAVADRPAAPAMR